MAIKYLDANRIRGSSTGDFVAGQGYDGASGVTNDAGGGGGAGAAATNKNAGNGKASSITGNSVTYAGGGGAAANGSNAGGTGGSGGGGAGGSNDTAGYGGTDGLGGGAGGGGNVVGNDATGGSGVVILRFTTSTTTYSTSGSPNVDTSTVSGKTILKYLASGTFVVSGGTPNVEYLVVAGGGGSMDNWGHAGGSGAGGMKEGTKSSMSNATYTVTVGDGGVGSESAPLQGGNSVFSDVTSTGGGYGGNWVGSSTRVGGAGGSGGGASSGSSNWAGGTGIGSSSTDEKATLINSPDYDGSGTWATTGSQVTQSSGVITFDITTRLANHTVTKDLSTALSNAAWVMRCKLDFTTLNEVGDSTTILEVGMSSDSSSTAMSTSAGGDYIGLQLRELTGGSGHGWGLQNYNDEAVDNGAEDPAFDAYADTSTTYYVEIKRLSTTSMSIGLYTDSDYDTLISGLPLETKTGMSSSIQGLQYIRIGNSTHSSQSNTQTIEGTLQDIQIWNAVTTAVPATTIPENTLFEETDTYKTYWLQSSEWRPRTPTYTGDMLGDWVGTSGYTNAFTVDATNNEFDLLDNYASSSASGAGKTVSLDLSDIETISTTAWCLRFTFQTTGQASSDNPVWWVGLADRATVASNATAIDYAGFGLQVGNGTTQLRPYQSMCNNSRLDQSTVQARLQLGGSDINLASDNTKYYCQVVRDGSNFICKVFSDSGFSTLLCERSNAMPTDAVSHLILSSYIQGASVTGTFGGVQFWNGATEP